MRIGQAACVRRALSSKGNNVGHEAKKDKHQFSVRMAENDWLGKLNASDLQIVRDPSPAP